MNTPAIIETVNISHGMIWLPWAVSYFFFIGLALSAALISLVWSLAGRKEWEQASRMAIFTMLTSAIVAPVALLADLHQPGRFWHFYTNFTPWSWMSWGAFLLPLFIGFVLVYGWLALRSDARRGDPSWALKPVALMVGMLALLIALYTGMEVMVVKSRPLWNSYYLPVAYLLTGICGAAGVSLLLQYFLGNSDPESRRQLSRTMALSAWLSMAVIGLWIISGTTGMSETASRALAAISGNDNWMMIGLAIAILLVIAGIIPLIGSSAALLSVIGIAAVSAAWLFRWAIFIDGQTIPKTGAGSYVYHLPAGSEGWLGIIGVFGLWLFVAIAIVTVTYRNDEAGSANIVAGE